MRFLFIRHRWKTLSVLALLLLGYIFCLPAKLFKDPTSMVLLDKNGDLLGAKISADGQWRFPHSDSVPDKFAICITEFEDHRFYRHWGIDIWSVGRALSDNWNAGKVKRGASTITMQVIRLSRKRKGRSWYQKTVEIILATRLEWSYTKKEILALYSSNAPFGGNVVGLEAAAWRYFGKASSNLSWGESATLAVLPNSPGLIHPGRNREKLQQKRDLLLNLLYQRGKLDSLNCALAKSEPLPDEPLPLPSLTPHLLERVAKAHFDEAKKSDVKTRLKTTIDAALQRQSAELLQRHYRQLSRKGIHNLACLIGDINTGEIIAYVGNIEDEDLSDTHGDKVDIIRARRSTGSILKPFLYAFMLEEGHLLPETLIPDVPTSIKGYRPQNFFANFDGMVSAHRAIERSLNVPLVRMLQNYGTAKFHGRLQQLGLQTIDKSAKHYGLSLILGGAEACLEDLAAAYASMARTLNHYHLQAEYHYYFNDFRPLSYLPVEKEKLTASKTPPLLSAAAIYRTFEAMRVLERPASEGAWEYFQSARQLAWKTGTSFGFRDAWAVGVTNRYVVAVWVGNADGEGRPELVGVRAAAPVLFDLLDLLPIDGEAWFEMPKAEMAKIAICKHSGYQASRSCETIDSVLVGIHSVHLPICPFHQILHLDAHGQYQVHGDCEMPANMVHTSWFVLPPLEETYYKAKNPMYRPAPPFREDCKVGIFSNSSQMDFIYPKKETKIFLPRNYDGRTSKTVFKATHRNPKSQIHWHLNAEYIGTTTEFHEVELQPEAGRHRILLVDEQGNRLEQYFTIVRDR